MNFLKKKIAEAGLCLFLLICGGCGASLYNSHYVYTPGDKFNNDMKSLPVNVGVKYLDDLRGNESKDNVSLIFIPLIPYAKSHYDRPETEYKFAGKGLKPNEDFAKALVQEMEQNKLFKEVFLVQQEESKTADMIVTGRIKKASIETIVTSYGLSLLGFVPWIVGLPEGKVYNELDIEFEMRRTYDSKVVWKCNVKGDWNKIIAFYYNQSKEDPFFGMNELLRKNLREGLSELAEDIKHKPFEFWNH
ncbi:MAG: hypothetical protein HXX11_23110 [Desulfuromonadales bacterium]|nr:hypothetical protein [Desulfuromonadales bacterium]